MTVRRLNDDDFETITAQRERGRSYTAIAQSIGCSASAVYYHCLRLGAEPPRPQKLPTGIRGPAVMMRGGSPVRRFTAEEDARLLALEAEGKTETEIGKVLGRRFNSVRGRLMTLARREARSEASA